MTHPTTDASPHAALDWVIAQQQSHKWPPLVSEFMAHFALTVPQVAALLAACPRLHIRQKTYDDNFIYCPDELRSHWTWASAGLRWKEERP